MPNPVSRKGILLAVTLPQAIILRTEPDLAPAPDEEPAAATLHSGR